ncbi:FAD-dependent oxidoreductase [Nocardioides sp. R-C-SC26]|uniref:protoporphyrinogen/coproporphyrinogen oxidase n=1 Tax=Nocardioides sp. R-C-SC26 TaxID=2870414 RepID=UPI001E2F514C
MTDASGTEVRRVAVIGAGIAGLTAAHALRRAGREVVVLDGADRVGGKLRRAEVGGVVVDVGAEAMVNRRPEGVALAADLGLDVVHPTDAAAHVWTRGGLRRLPRTLLGAPLDLNALEGAGILTDDGMVRARHQHAAHLAPGVDISVGELVAHRFGDEVVERLVEPLLGGVYAGYARGISARAAAPQLVPLLSAGGVVGEVPPPVDPTPFFAGIPGGMTRLADALAAGLDVRTGAMVREVQRAERGFLLVTGAASAPLTERVDEVVVATPAHPAARLLGGVAPSAATELARFQYASVVVVTLAFRLAQVLPEMFRESGFLVPPVDGRRIKAATFSFAKWDWVRRAGEDAGGLVVLRTSLGRLGDELSLQATDAELVGWSLADLREAAGLSAVPVATHVQRWGGGLPQYEVGHLDRVARVRAAVESVAGLAVCGAAYDGVGIAACVASGQAGAARIIGTGAALPD